MYHYEANGKKHTSSQLETCRQTNNTAKKNIDNEFPIGSTTVSDDPSDAVLLTGLAGDNYSPIGRGRLVVLISLTMLHDRTGKTETLPRQAGRIALRSG